MPYSSTGDARLPGYPDLPQAWFPTLWGHSHTSRGSRWAFQRGWIVWLKPPLCCSAGVWTPNSTWEEIVSYPQESQGLTGFVRQGPQEVGEEEKGSLRDHFTVLQKEKYVGLQVKCKSPSPLFWFVNLGDPGSLCKSQLPR